jgi:hypothetical protein
MGKSNLPQGAPCHLSDRSKQHADMLQCNMQAQSLISRPVEPTRFGWTPRRAAC